MSTQHRLPSQAMTPEDRQFDALLRRAAQYSQEVTMDMQRRRNISRESRQRGKANRPNAKDAATG